MRTLRLCLTLTTLAAGCLIPGAGLLEWVHAPVGGGVTGGAAVQAIQGAESGGRPATEDQPLPAGDALPHWLRPLVPASCCPAPSIELAPWVPGDRCPDSDPWSAEFQGPGFAPAPCRLLDDPFALPVEPLRGLPEAPADEPVAPHLALPSLAVPVA